MEIFIYVWLLICKFIQIFTVLNDKQVKSTLTMSGLSDAFLVKIFLRGRLNETCKGTRELVNKPPSFLAYQGKLFNYDYIGRTWKIEK